MKVHLRSVTSRRFIKFIKKPNEFFSRERLQKEQIGVGFKVYEDVVARHASRGADSKLSNALDDGIFYHVFSQFSSLVE